MTREEFVHAEAELTVIFDLASGERYTLKVPKVVEIGVTQQWRYGQALQALGIESLMGLGEELERLVIDVKPLRRDAMEPYFVLQKDLSKR